MTNKERMRRAIEFDDPDYPPVMGGFSPATWGKYREALIPYAERLRVPVPGDFDAMPKGYRAGESFRDNYDCLWECQGNGLQGIIKEHPLSAWSRLESYRFPDPLTQGENGVFDLPAFAAQAAAAREEWTWAGGYENRFWERLHFLHGYEPTLTDLADEDERLFRLLDRSAAPCKGRICVAIDSDRQHVLPFGAPADVRNHVRECVAKLDRHGGVIILWNVNPDVPLANVAALTEAIERLRKG